MYHYTYLIQHKTENKRYIGCRSSKVLPVEDAGYWGSSKYLPKDVKLTHVKIILKTFSTREEALQHEITLHKVNNVASDDSYYNKSIQTSSGFSTLGVTPKHTKTEEWSKKCFEYNKTRDYTKLKSFNPWYIKSPDNKVTIYTDTTKKEQAILDGHHIRYYESLAARTNYGERCISRGPLKGYFIGNIVDDIV